MTERLEVSEEGASRLAYDSVGEVDEDFEWPWREISDEIVDQGRWHIIHEKIIHRTDNDTYWKFRFALGATEYQDDRDFETSLTRVYPCQVERVEYSDTPPAGLSLRQELSALLDACQDHGWRGSVGDLVEAIADILGD